MIDVHKELSFLKLKDIAKIMNEKCAECQNKKTCIRCKIPYVLQGEKCQNECENGYYDSERVCIEYCSST